MIGNAIGRHNVGTGKHGLVGVNDTFREASGAPGVAHEALGLHIAAQLQRNRLAQAIRIGFGAFRLFLLSHMDEMLQTFRALFDGSHHRREGVIINDR